MAEPADTQTQGRQPPLVWDLPLRVFHWSLAIAVAVCLYTGLDGGFYIMDWHMLSGYVVLGLLFFRIAWGFVGPPHARFGNFLRGPGAIWYWLRGALRLRPPASIGHNPVAGWFILLMLAVLLLQAVTGLFASDEIFTSGPLRSLAPEEYQRLANRIHRQGEWVVGALVGVHLLALLVHRLAFRERLVVPMITGRNREAPPTADIGSQRLLLAVILAAAATGATWYLINL